MGSIQDLARGVEAVVHPFGEVEVLLLYGVVAPYLRKYLAGKELAAKNWFSPKTFPAILKRGSNSPPLSVDQLAEAITPEFLQLRVKSLDEVRAKLTPVQENVWRYFPPRKLSDLFYATNGERKDSPIDRIFIDIDRGEGVSADTARKVALDLVNTIIEDKQVGDVIGHQPDPWVCWTGRSFHVYIFLREKRDGSFYHEHFKIEKDSLETFTGRWADRLRRKSSIQIAPGHEKMRGAITIDPSQTPPGKLCRVPLGALHMMDWKHVDGVSVPLTLDMLSEPDLVRELQAYTPERVVRELDRLAARLPSQFRAG